MHVDARGYAYESYREGGRVCRRYVGTGPWISGLVEMDKHDRQAKERQRAAQKAQLEKLEAAGKALDVFCAASEVWRRAALQAGGYRQHKRGPWRKRRQAKRSNSMATPKATPQTLSKSNDPTPGNKSGLTCYASPIKATKKRR